MPPTIDRRASAVATPVPEIKSFIEQAFAPAVSLEPLVSAPESAFAVSPLSDEHLFQLDSAAEPDSIFGTDSNVKEDHARAASTVGRSRIVRMSPWPAMVVLGGMALVTVSAIGLRSGSSSSTTEVPPLVASPLTPLPDGYVPQLPAAPLPADESLTPPNSALGESPWKSLGPTARGAIATASLPATVTPSVPARSAASPPAVTAPAPSSEPPVATSASSTLLDASAAEPGREPVTVVEPPADRSEPAFKTPSPTSAPPAVSSARPATASAAASEPVPELPRPAARTSMTVVAARRLTGSMPEYSRELRQRKVGGVVDVQLRIDVNGRVVSAIAMSGPPPLREIAEAAVLKWRYAPATRNGIPIETESKVSFSFDPSQTRRP